MSLQPDNPQGSKTTDAHSCIPSGPSSAQTHRASFPNWLVVPLIVLLSLSGLSLGFAADRIPRIISNYMITVQYNFTADGSGNATGYTQSRVAGNLECVELIPTDSQSDAWAVEAHQTQTLDNVTYYTHPDRLFNRSFTGSADNTPILTCRENTFILGATACPIGIFVTGYDPGERGTVRLTFGVGSW